ncbi:hypothetical protein [Actinomadura rupiterrae]|uniref:hypothetical protein n=1 Tax=Actinomadura rupiterrae TaxID=559627 RepID=UPI0020A37312|nr:hypothetical protein [Actinomadura rupiterrae]MCP2341606.1 hypothetical protein [Actinomadura rupiterrae]
MADPIGVVHGGSARDRVKGQKDESRNPEQIALIITLAAPYRRNKAGFSNPSFTSSYAFAANAFSMLSGNREDAARPLLPVCRADH